MKSKVSYNFNLESLNTLDEISNSLQVNKILSLQETFYLHKLMEKIFSAWDSKSSDEDIIKALNLIFDTEILGKDRDKIYTQIAESLINRADKGVKRVMTTDDKIDWMATWCSFLKQI